MSDNGHMITLIAIAVPLAVMGAVDALAMKYGDKPTDLQGVLEALSTKVGAVLLILGAMHFFNLYVFSKMRRRALLNGAPPPIPPHGHVPVAGR